MYFYKRGRKESTMNRFNTNVRVVVVTVKALSRVRLFRNSWNAARQASLSFTISQNLFTLMSIELMMPSNHFILCHPVLLLSSIFPSIFSNELALRIMWPKCWSFNFSIIPSTKYLGLTSFRIDWFDLFPVQEALQSSSVPQFESISSSAFGFFCGSGLTSVHDYWKTVALTIRALVGKVMFLLFNMLSRFVSFPS